MSIMITNMVSGAAQPAVAASVKATPETQQPEAAIPVRSRTPTVDEYTPEGKREPFGRYWLGKDEDGQPKVYFDNPERDDGADGLEPKAADGKKAETCTGITDQVDREIERLKKLKETLEQQINTQTDDAKVEELERKLTQVERELAQKDNDTYRRQHTIFS